MPIITGDAILKLAGLNSVVQGATAAVSNNGFSPANVSAGTPWNNTFDAPEASAVLSLAFATMPTYGSIGLFAHVLDIDGAGGDPPKPSIEYRGGFVGGFAISTDATLNGVTHLLELPRFTIPVFDEGQQIDWYIENSFTDQTISAGWDLLIGPFTYGPKPAAV